MKKYRIIIPNGYIEFPLLSEAETYRNEHHPGCEILEVDYETPPDPNPE